jgi:ABC-type transport system involved in multi-copper enzyme maturation permease subunit
MMRLILIHTQEWLRLKFFHVVLFLSFSYFLISYLLGSLDYIQHQRLIFDFGLAGLEISVLFVAAFISTHALHRDIDRKTILVLLARPIPRWHLLVGYLGSLILLNMILVTALGTVLFIFLGKTPYGLNLFVSLLSILMKSVVISSFGLLCSVLARPMFSFVIAISYWMMGYSIPDLQYFAKKMDDSLLIAVGNSLDYLIPNFYAFNWKNYHFLRSELSANDFLWSMAHCFGWVFCLLFLASLFFRRKEIV